MSESTGGAGPFGNLFESETSRRDFLVRGGGGLAGMSLLGLAACGGDSGASGTITIAMNPGHEKTVVPALRRFNASNPDLKAKVQMYPQDSGQYFDRLRTQLQAGSDEIDVIAGDVSWPAQFSTNGWIEDLSNRFTPAMQKQFLAGPVDSNIYEDKVWGVPWYTDCGLLFYRKDLLEKSGFSGPPKTWDELKEMAKKVRQDSKIKYGLTFTGAAYEGGTVLGTEFIRCAGGDILDGDRVVIGEPAAVKGLAMQQSLVKEGIAPKAVANYKEDENTAAFLQGHVAFMRQWPYAYDFISDKKQSKITTAQVGMTRVPVVEPSVTPTNVGGGWNFYINATSQNQEGAWKLIKYLAAERQQESHALEHSFLPTLTRLYKDPQIEAKLPAVRLGGDAVKQTTTPPISPYYSDMSLKMGKAFNENVLGTSSSEDVANRLNDELGSIVKRG